MSDPSQLHLPIHTALTSDMMIGLKPSAPKSRSYRLSVAPVNKSTFLPTDQMIFECPTGRRGTWLDQSQSYLKFSVQCQSVTAAGTYSTKGNEGIFVDNTAYSFIQRLDVYNSSNLLETINEYGQLANLLIDTSLTQSDKAGLSAMIGTNPNSYVSTSGANATTAGVQFASTATAGDRLGASLTSVKQTDGAISTAIPYTFCLPILSGVVGVNASKMLPVGKLSTPIRLEFYLAANDDAIYYGALVGATIWQIVNVELCLCYVEILDDQFDNFSNEIEYISTSTYRQSSSTLPASTSGDYTVLLPFRAASITALYGRFRPFGSAAQGVNATAAYRKGSSCNPSMSSYYFRVGSSVYPNKPVYLIFNQSGTGSEGYAELLKSFHALSSSIGNSAITYSQYNVASNALGGYTAVLTTGNRTSQASSNMSNYAFAIGLECQSFSNRNDTILSGISTLNSQIYFTGNIYTGLTAGDGTLNLNFTCDFFSAMDMILVIDQNGVMSAKF